MSPWYEQKHLIWISMLQSQILETQQSNQLLEVFGEHLKTVGFLHKYISTESPKDPHFHILTHQSHQRGSDYY